MRIFVTGATGFVGSAVVKELLGVGHRVTGLARSDKSASLIAAAGAQVHRGTLEDVDSLRSGAAAADAVIHTGFIHDFARLQEVCDVDKQAIAALGSALVGSERPLIVTSGMAFITPGRPVTEEDPQPPHSKFPRRSEQAAAALAVEGVRVSIVRLPPSVHGEGDHGFLPILINIAREKGVSAYVGDGLNRWCAVHRRDAGSLFRLAVENATPGARFHGAAEEEVPFRDIAEVIGRRLNLPVVRKSPEEAAEHFGWFSVFAGTDCPATSERTRHQLAWEPKHSGLITDVERTASYFEL